MAPKNPKKLLKNLNFVPHHPINTPLWLELISHPFHHIFTLFFTHTTSSSNSSEMENQLTMVFQGVMKEAMSMLQAEEVVTAVASSSI
jgi:hypothetical protein